MQLLGLIGAVRTQTTKSGGIMAYVQFEDLYGAMELLVFPQTLSRYGPLVQAGNVVLVQGRLSAREEEEPKLLADRFSEAPPPGAEPAAQPEPRPEAPPAAPKARSDRHGLYLRLPSKDCPAYKRAENLLAIFEGEEPVYIRFTDTGKLVRAPRSLWIWPNAPLFGELRRVLGDENVALVD